MTTDPHTMPKEQLVDALRAGADGADMRAAVEMLVGYNEGDLLDYPEVRRHIELWDKRTGTCRVDWLDLYDEVTRDDSELAGALSSTGYGAVMLACALHKSVEIKTLARTLEQFDRHNSRVALRAFAIALGAEQHLADPNVAAATARANEPALVTMSPQHLGERIVALLMLAPDGMTAEQLVDKLTAGGIATNQLAVTAALGMIAAAHKELQQPEPHGPYYWRP